MSRKDNELSYSGKLVMAGDRYEGIRPPDQWHMNSIAGGGDEEPVKTETWYRDQWYQKMAQRDLEIAQEDLQDEEAKPKYLKDDRQKQRYRDQIEKAKKQIADLEAKWNFSGDPKGKNVRRSGGFLGLGIAGEGRILKPGDPYYDNSGDSPNTADGRPYTVEGQKGKGGAYHSDPEGKAAPAQPATAAPAAAQSPWKETTASQMMSSAPSAPSPMGDADPRMASAMMAQPSYDQQIPMAPQSGGMSPPQSQGSPRPGATRSPAGASAAQFVMPPLSEMVAPNGGAYAGMESRAPASAQGKPVYNYYSSRENPFYAGDKIGWIPYPARAGQPGAQAQPQGQVQQPGQSQYAPMAEAASRSPAGVGAPVYADPEEDMYPDAEAEGDPGTVSGPLGVVPSRSGLVGDIPREPVDPNAPRPNKMLVLMDELARSQGYKDARDQSDSIGRGVMMGQIGGLAAPAVGAAGASATGPVAAEATAGAPAAAEQTVLQVNRAGPIRNLPRPGSPLFEEVPESAAMRPETATPRSPYSKFKFRDAAQPGAAEAESAAAGAGASASGGGVDMDEFYSGLNQAQSQGGQVPQAVQTGMKALAYKFPAIKLAMAASGGVVSWPVVKIALSHPQMAAALAAASVPVAATGTLGMSVAAGQVGMRAADRVAAMYNAPKSQGSDQSNNVQSRVNALKGEDSFQMNGFRNVIQHAGKKAFTDAEIERAFESPKVMQMMMHASDMKPGTPAMQNVYEQIKKELAQ